MFGEKKYIYASDVYIFAVMLAAYGSRDGIDWLDCHGICYSYPRSTQV